jgi:hypothetical protein
VGPRKPSQNGPGEGDSPMVPRPPHPPFGHLLPPPHPPFGHPLPGGERGSGQSPAVSRKFIGPSSVTSFRRASVHLRRSPGRHPNSIAASRPSPGRPSSHLISTYDDAQCLAGLRGRTPCTGSRRFHKGRCSGSTNDSCHRCRLSNRPDRQQRRHSLEARHWHQRARSSRRKRRRTFAAAASLWYSPPTIAHE